MLWGIPSSNQLNICAIVFSLKRGVAPSSTDSEPRQLAAEMGLANQGLIQSTRPA